MARPRSGLHPSVVLWPRGILLASALAGTLAGCFRSKDINEHCDDPAEYQASVAAAGLTTPDGLVAPNKASGYAVPPATAKGELRGAACLARPPPYFRREPPAGQAAPAGQPAPAGQTAPPVEVAPPGK